MCVVPWRIPRKQAKTGWSGCGRVGDVYVDPFCINHRLVAMSLINQVLNDLDKRGVAREATGDEAIRVVPIQTDSNGGCTYCRHIISCRSCSSRIECSEVRCVFKVCSRSNPSACCRVLSISHAPVASQPLATSAVVPHPQASSAIALTLHPVPIFPEPNLSSSRLSRNPKLPQKLRRKINPIVP